MGDLLGALGLGVLSALIPLVNIEAYLGVHGALAGTSEVWLLGLMAALGQMAGKTVWSFLGANALSWGWVRRKMEKPKAQQRLELWRDRVHQRPVVAGLLTFGSAFTGFPPFAVLAVLAGQLRMSLLIFLGLGLLGRWLRFSAVLGGAAWLSRFVS